MNNAITSLAELDAKLREFENLPDDWDSYGGKAISPGMCQKAREIFLAIGAWGFSLIPCTGDGIQIEEHRKGCDVEVYIHAVELATVYTRDAHGSEEIADLDIPRLKQLVAEIGIAS